MYNLMVWGEKKKHQYEFESFIWTHSLQEQKFADILAITTSLDCYMQAKKVEWSFEIQ